MSDRMLRRGVTEDKNAAISDTIEWTAYLESLNLLEKSLNNMIFAFLQHQQALQHRSQTPDCWNKAEIIQIRHNTISSLKALICLQTQLLKKYEALWEAEQLDEHQLTISSICDFSEANILPSFRMLLQHPRDWRKIHQLLREINRYREKKGKIANLPLQMTVSVQVRPWINAAIVHSSRNEKR